MQDRTCHLRVSLPKSRACYLGATEASSQLAFLVEVTLGSLPFYLVKETSSAGIEPVTLMATSQLGVSEPSRLRDVVVSKLV